MKRLFALLLAGIMCVSLASCGEKEEAKDDATSAPTNASSDVEKTDTQPKKEPVKVDFNEKIALDFVEITFEENYIKEDIRQRITNGSVTRIFGPTPESGKQFIALKGKIKNIAKQELPVYDFFIGEFDIDGYKFEITANNCDVYTSNGQTESSIPPLTEYDFIMYAGIPNELANSNSSINFTFGFYDMFDNSELSRNRAFEDDPISLCPYQYTISIK